MTKPIRVVELGGGVAPTFAAKLFGDHGGDVIKVEPPGGDPLRAWGPFADAVVDPEQGGLFMALNLNKRGVVVDVETAQGRRALGDLLAWADVLIHGLDRRVSARLHIDAEALAASHPGLVALAITPFGHSGPYADYVATDLTLTNAGGWANLCPCTHTDPELPPLKVFGEQCGLMAGIAGATAALSARLAADRSGVGEFIDLSIQEYVASVLEIALPATSYTGEGPTRVHPRSLIPWRNFATKDGMVFLVCVEQDQWERLVEFMGNPDWASMEVFAEQASRGENQDLVHTFVAEFVAEWETEPFYHAAQKHRVCVAPVLELHQIARNEHLRARDFFVEVARAGSPTLEYLAPAVRSGDGREAIRLAAPRLGEHNALLDDLPTHEIAATDGRVDLPLTGVRVLDMTWAWAGPFCTMNLAHLGAEVIRLESELRPDLYRRFPVVPPELEPGLNRSGMFNQWNQGKSSIAIDLGQPDGIALVKRLVAEADVVVQNFATGVMERLGLGYEVLRDINPGIVLASVSGYGQSGPYAQYMGYGPAMPPLTGLSAATGYLDGPPEELGLSMPDPTAGITAAWAVVSALEKRRHSGAGEHLDVTLWESTGVLNAEGWMGYVLTGQEPARIQNRSPRMAPHGVFRCLGEDAWVSIACRDDGDWARLVALLESDGVANKSFDARLGLAERLARVAELETVLAAWTADRDRWDVTRRLQAIQVPAFPTLSAPDVLADPHLNERGFIERLEHPEVGAQAHAGIPWRLTRRANGVRSPSPCMGADTAQHLREILSLDDDQIEQLNARGVVSCLAPSRAITPPV